MIRRSLVASLLACAAIPAAAQVPAGNSAPQPVPIVNTIPPAVDTPYPGTIKLNVDVTNTRQGIMQVSETIPLANRNGGDVVLLFPEWLPGNHSPTGQLDKLAGLMFTANGKPVSWTRDPVDVYAFHLDVPAGANQIEAKFQFLSATADNQGRIAVTPNLISLQPNSVSLYPAGYFTRQIPVQMNVTYPSGWTAAGALRGRSTTNAAGTTYAYEPTNYEILVDSPILAGKYGKTWQLSPKVALNVFADTPDELAATPEQIDAHKRLVDQAVKNFGAQHYDHYDFLLSISDQLGGIGLEHHRSSENGVRPGYFTKWNEQASARNLLPHEYTHSWDGKFRRGADLWTPDFRMPMRDSLLWVYEGQTQFWGYVLQTRAGLVSKQDTLDQYAAIMALYDSQPARHWRPLIDTTNDPIISQRRPKGWPSWQRSEDYYNEGLLVWMDVDSLLREKSGGTKSIDDFAKAFFGVRDGDWGELTYTLDDVAATLNGIVPWDWKAYLVRRLTEKAPGAPLDGFARNGYKLVYTAEPTPIFKSNEKTRKITDATYSLGMVVSEGGDNPGRISSVTWDSPAFKAGFVVGDQVVAVGGQDYSSDRLKDAITAAKDPKTPVTLLVKHGNEYRTVTLDYHDGLRYPRLQKTGTGEGGLDRLLTPR